MATRKTEGKLQWHLLLPECIEPVIEVLMMGAKKYSVYGDCTCHQITSNAGSVEKCSNKQDSSAETATIDGLKNKTQNIERDKWVIASSGQRRTANVLITIISTGQEIMLQGDMELIAKSLMSYLQEDVKFVVELMELSASTMTTAMEESEDVCASPVMSESDGLRMKNGFQGHVHTCPALQIVKSGESNWREEPYFTREQITDSMKRHQAAIERGELIDQESGLLHSAHVACNALFQVYYDAKGLWDYEHEPNEKSPKDLRPLWSAVCNKCRYPVYCNDSNHCAITGKEL